MIINKDQIKDNRILPFQMFNAIEKHQNSKAFVITSTRTTKQDSENDREHLYEERRHVINEGCKKINRTKLDRTEISSSTAGLIIDKVHSIYYCPIPKVSSTFWKRVLTVMASRGKLNSPFDISLGGVRLAKINDLSKRELNSLNTKGTSFIVARNPYARLFSGYENKIYHSNLMFWKLTGRQVVHVIRKDNNDVYNNYGFDVTFPEFIKYILYLHESGLGINGHFRPMLSLCDPCSIYFQYFVKLETLSDDARFLITKWRNDFDDVNLRFEDFEKETVLDTARGHVNFLFSTKKVLDEIKFPFIKIMLRTWRDLQIRGYLSKHIPFPFKETDVETVTKEEYMEAIKTALKIPVNRTEVKLQRKEALIQAYRQVPIKDMERLRQFVLEDCLVFGYDDRPAELFDRSKSVSREFVYLDGLTKK
ncbi:carbohydrate sulfotransferase 11-like isoform X2 [Ruditapes philippinarum]|uniref:carbohydrate sulfotransferase 11-like isoform X2 n=1 Tax=Ruditapes philippinarum TaxID=129788 RepID=UPI00295AAA76|nr:carbohydrate sulfotransferase 11-like isoform X2 [Ruditapes philippinarum]